MNTVYSGLLHIYALYKQEVWDFHPLKKKRDVSLDRSVGLVFH